MTDEHNVRLSFEEGDPIAIACRSDEDVVTAALRQGVLLVSDCRQGICGACRAFLKDGRYDQLLEHSQHALSDYDEENGWVLACRLRPCGDMHLDFDYPADRVGRLETRRRAARIVSLERLAPSVIRLVVRTLAAQEPLRWEAGQYVRLQLSSSGVTRAYSIANLAAGTRDLEFFIRLLPGGAFSKTLAAIGREGTAVTVEGPLGGFTLDTGDHELVFVAGGTGLAPILAMLRKLALETPHRRATLIFGADREETLFGNDVLHRVQAACSALTIRMTVAEPGPSWTGLRGTAVDVLARWIETAADPTACRYYLSGPAQMVKAARAVAARRGVPVTAIHQESFIPTGIDA